MAQVSMRVGVRGWTGLKWGRGLAVVIALWIVMIALMDFLESEDLITRKGEDRRVRCLATVRLTLASAAAAAAGCTDPVRGG
jgi:hypothetical protein